MNLEFSNLAMLPSIEIGGVNEAITLFSGDLSINHMGHKSQESGVVEFNFLPHARIVLSVGSPTTEVLESIFKVDIPGADTDIEVLLASSGFTMTAGQRVLDPLKGILQCPDGGVTFGNKERLGRVRAHLINFRSYVGDLISTRLSAGGLRTWPGRCSFKMGPWKVTLDLIQGGDDRLSSAAQSQGYVVTHVLNLEKPDKSKRISKLFGTSEAVEALDVLDYILTFMNGSRTACVVPVGYRFQEGYVWRAWRSHKIDTASHDLSWFPVNSPSEGFKCADRIYSLLKDPDQREWLSHAIQLYALVNRNSDGVDIELAKAQVALELLAWQICQERQQLLSKEGFERSSASDRIRIALLWAGISPEVPPSLKSLSQWLNSNGLGDGGPLDGPFAITYIRNATIHPTTSKRTAARKLGSIAIAEAWTLSKFYIELMILRLVDYHGPFMDRCCHIHTQRQVPWSAV